MEQLGLFDNKPTPVEPMGLQLDPESVPMVDYPLVPVWFGGPRPLTDEEASFIPDCGVYPDTLLTRHFHS